MTQRDRDRRLVTLAVLAACLLAGCEARRGVEEKWDKLRAFQRQCYEQGSVPIRLSDGWVCVTPAQAAAR